MIANVDGAVHTLARGVARTCSSRQLTSPVEFLDATLALPETVTTTIEMPPGGVLTGLTKRIRDVRRPVRPDVARRLQEIAP